VQFATDLFPSSKKLAKRQQIFNQQTLFSRQRKVFPARCVDEDGALRVGYRLSGGLPQFLDDKNPQKKDSFKAAQKSEESITATFSVPIHRIKNFKYRR
jgi:hypothetical protein